MDLSLTETEMFESQSVLKHFNFNLTKDLAQKIGSKRLLITGMGSSLIFPGTHAKARALSLNLHQPLEIMLTTDTFELTDFSNTHCILISNSGETKETIKLFDYLNNQSVPTSIITSVADSTLAKRCQSQIILSGGFERGVAATKSVIEQGLILDSLIHHLAYSQGTPIDFKQINQQLINTASTIPHNLNLKLNSSAINELANASALYFIGLNSGVAEEICLKAFEIARKPAFFMPGTHILHGPAEAIQGNCAIIFEVNKFKDYLSDFTTFSHKTGCRLLGIDYMPLIPGLNLQSNVYFGTFCSLAAGWGLLCGIAHALQIDIDHPQMISKVGNRFLKQVN